MTPQEYERQFEILSLGLKRGAGSYWIWIELFPTEPVVDILNYHSDFFGPVRDALFASTILELDKALETYPKAASLVNLLRAASNDQEHLAPHLSADDLASLQAKLDLSTDARHEVRQLRNKRVAHSDASSPEDLAVVKGQLDRLYADVISVFSALESGRKLRYPSLSAQTELSKRAAKTLLRALERDRERS